MFMFIIALCTGYIWTLESPTHTETYDLTSSKNASVSVFIQLPTVLLGTDIKISRKIRNWVTLLWKSGHLGSIFISSYHCLSWIRRRLKNSRDQSLPSDIQISAFLFAETLLPCSMIREFIFYISKKNCFQSQNCNLKFPLIFLWKLSVVSPLLSSGSSQNPSMWLWWSLECNFFTLVENIIWKDFFHGEWRR